MKISSKLTLTLKYIKLCESSKKKTFTGENGWMVFLSFYYLFAIKTKDLLQRNSYLLFVQIDPNFPSNVRLGAGESWNINELCVKICIVVHDLFSKMPCQGFESNMYQDVIKKILIFKTLKKCQRMEISLLN